MLYTPALGSCAAPEGLRAGDWSPRDPSSAATRSSGAAPARRLLPGGDYGLELGDPCRDRLGLVADRACAVLPLGRRQWGQPPRPIPGGLGAGAVEHVDLDVFGRRCRAATWGHQPPAGGAPRAYCPARLPRRRPAWPGGWRPARRDERQPAPAVLFGGRIGQLHRRRQAWRCRPAGAGNPDRCGGAPTAAGAVPTPSSTLGGSGQS